MKLAICVPARDTVHAGFAVCLANLTARLQKNQIDFEILFTLGSVIASQRNNLVAQALELDCTHILWIDSDMHFPASIVEKFLKHNKKIIAANYSTRVKPLRSVAFTNRKNLMSRLTETKGLHQVFAIGMGCMLVNIDVYKTMPKPWYSYEWNEDLQDICGEDIWFCNQAQNHGFEIWVDCDASQFIAHYGTKAYVLGETIE